MSNTNACDLSTEKGRRQMKKAVGRRLQRDDFPATPEGWTWFCEYRVGIATRSLKRDQRSLDYWNSVKKSEHLVDAMEKVNALAEAQSQIEKLTAELAAAKAGANKKQS